jgi:ABC-2 type transport system ATP-binding protein
VIRTERLTKTFGDKTAVDGLDIDVRPGEILGFLGPNGAGKSTTVKMLTGLLPPTAGNAWIGGFSILGEPIEAKRRLGFVPETPKLYESLSADGFLDVIGALHHLDPAESQQRRRRLLQILELEAVQHQRLREFSKGMRQKVVIASALLADPEVLILDEPFDGIDATTAGVLKLLFRDLAAQGRTILFSSHILDVVERVCTRIVIIDKGRVLTEGTAGEICERYRTGTLEEAFAVLTGVRATSDVAADLLAAISPSAPGQSVR